MGSQTTLNPNLAKLTFDPFMNKIVDRTVDYPQFQNAIDVEFYDPLKSRWVYYTFYCKAKRPPQPKDFDVRMLSQFSKMRTVRRATGEVLRVVDIDIGLVSMHTNEQRERLLREHRRARTTFT